MKNQLNFYMKQWIKNYRDKKAKPFKLPMAIDTELANVDYEDNQGEEYVQQELDCNDIFVDGIGLGLAQQSQSANSSLSSTDKMI